MSPQSAPLILAVGSVVILTVYGFRQLKRERLPEDNRNKSGSKHGGDHAVAELALAAEFTDRTASDCSWRLSGGAVLCPSCGMEYPVGVVFCDCGVATEDADDHECGSLEEMFGEVEVEDSLVCVYKTGDTWKAELLRSFLDSHSIHCQLKGNVPSGFANFDFLGQPEIQLLIPSTQLSEARRLMEFLED